MGAKALLKRASKIERQERKGAAKIIAAPYSDADLKIVKQSITEGQGPAWSFLAADRRKAVEAVEMLVVRDPKMLGKIIERYLSSDTNVGPVFSLINYAASRR